VGAVELVKGLRDDPETRCLSVVALARGDFASSELALLGAGANAVLRLPPTEDWDERLSRLVQVPVRRDVRAAVTLEVDLGLGASGSAFAALALNLSSSGLLIETNEPLCVGDEVAFVVNLPKGGGEVRGGARVIRHGPVGQFGLQIESVKGDGRVKIKRFVEGQ
jgi:Tfp pilus assembly protein PilZ